MEFLSKIWNNYIVNVLDILVVSYIFYKLLMLIKGTRAVQVLRGITILIIVTVIAQVLNFQTVGWILKWFWVAGIIAIVIVFQPELRTILANIGQSPLGKTFFKEKLVFIDEIIKALLILKKRRYGALIVLEQNTGLRNYMESGVLINGDVTSDLLCTIFMSPAPIHDGAVIVRDEKLIAAGCILPLTSERRVKNIMGTRHQAAVGITEVSDAWAIVVSEETGDISLAYGKDFERNIDTERLKTLLVGLYKDKLEQNRLFSLKNLKKR